MGKRKKNKTGKAEQATATTAAALLAVANNPIVRSLIVKAVIAAATAIAKDDRVRGGVRRGIGKLAALAGRKPLDDQPSLPMDDAPAKRPAE